MNPVDCNAHWYLIQTKPRQDARAEQNLVRQQYTCFVPLVPPAPSASGLRRRVVAQEYLFPGYLFIRLSSVENWYPIRSTRGVNRVVAFGGQPCRVSDALIEHIRQRVEQPLGATTSGTFAQGDTVMIRAGGTELQAIFLSEDGDERAVILLNLLQREQRISLPRSSLQAATVTLGALAY